MEPLDHLNGLRRMPFELLAVVAKSAPISLRRDLVSSLVRPDRLLDLTVYPDSGAEDSKGNRLLYIPTLQGRGGLPLGHQMESNNQLVSCISLSTSLIRA